MRASWGLMINVLLLIGVIVSFWRMMQIRNRQRNEIVCQPSLGVIDEEQHNIISVRKIDQNVPSEKPTLGSKVGHAKIPTLVNSVAKDVKVTNLPSGAQVATQAESMPVIVMFLLANAGQQFVGYELLQTLLTAGLRFGEGNLFHKHQRANGHGPILCSLAAATPNGTFDLQTIGALSVHGLCLFMYASGNSTIDAERFSIMLDTAQQLKEGLNAQLLDHERRILSEASILSYRRVLQLEDELASCD